MDSLIESGIDIILWLQSLGSWLTPVMRFFTFLGNEEFYLLVAPTILWCIDATFGLRLGLFLMVNGMIVNALKVAFHGARPFWYSKEVDVYGVAESSFGIPSGHSQNAVVVWGAIANRIKKNWGWVIAIILIFFIGISRLYFAVHFPHDVLVGWLFGLLMLVLFLRIEAPVVRWITKYTPAIQILIAFLFSLALILIVMLAVLVVGNWSLPTSWIQNALLAFPGEPEINPLSIYSILANPGAFFGLAAGWIWLTTKGGFTVRDVWWKLVLRYLLGIVGILILYLGLGAVFPKTETVLAFVLRYLRYALIGFWGSGFAPYLFVKLGLAAKGH